MPGWVYEQFASSSKGARGDGRRELPRPAGGCRLSRHGKRDQRISEHLRPGRKRAPLLRYVRINLPRATRLLLLFVVAVIGAASAAVALGDHEPFPFAAPILWGVFGVAVLFVVVGLVTSAPDLDVGPGNRAGVPAGLPQRPGG